MTLNQIFKYLDESLSPDKGGKIQIIPNGGNETIRIFIFNKEINSYSYVFNFNKESIDGKDVFSSSIRSGYSGIDYKLGLQLNIDLYNSIKETLLASDAVYMKFLEEHINMFVEEVPTDMQSVAEIPVENKEPNGTE